MAEHCDVCGKHREGQFWDEFGNVPAAGFDLGWRTLDYDSEVIIYGDPEGNPTNYLLCSWGCILALAKSKTTQGSSPRPQASQRATSCDGEGRPPEC